MDATNSRQQPWIASSPIPRNIILNPAEAVPPIPTTPPLLGHAPPDPPVPSPDTRGASLDLIQRAYKQLDSNIAALSHTLPDRLIEQTTPLSAISRWNCSLVYWLPRSE